MSQPTSVIPPTSPQDWRSALVRFLDAVTELAKLGTKALAKELEEKR